MFIIFQAACLVLFFAPLSPASADDVSQPIQRLIETQEGVTEPESKQILNEMRSIVSTDAALTKIVEADPGRVETTEAIMWAAARLAKFDDQKFKSSWPALTKFGNVLLVSGAYFKTPRIIYQTYADRMFHDVHMLYGIGDYPIRAPVIKVGSWKDPEQITDWIGDFTFQNREKGPYLVSVVEGRRTTGATFTRDILYWIRIESDRLVPDRFEAYDVPIGERRQARDLKVISLPARLISAPARERGAYQPREPDAIVKASASTPSTEISSATPTASPQISAKFAEPNASIVEQPAPVWLRVVGFFAFLAFLALVVFVVIRLKRRV